jgi:hypothetical protein
VGSFTLAEAHLLDAIVAEPDDNVLSLSEMLRDLPHTGLDEEQVRAASHGVVFPSGALAGVGDTDDHIALVDGRTHEVVAVYERRGAGYKPTVVLA